MPSKHHNIHLSAAQLTVSITNNTPVINPLHGRQHQLRRSFIRHWQHFLSISEPSIRLTLWLVLYLFSYN